MNTVNYKRIAANQLRISIHKIVYASRTWKNWVIELDSTDEDALILVIPHDKFYEINRLAEAISYYAV